MTEWILIIAMYAGTLAATDSTALTTVPFTFKTVAECTAAGNKAKSMETLIKTVKFVCVERKQ